MYLIVCTLFTSNWLHSMLLLFIFICFYSMIFNSLYFYLFMFLIIELFVYLFGSLEIYLFTVFLHYLPCSLHQVVPPPLYRTKQTTAFIIETPYENVAVWVNLLTQGELPNGSKKPASSRCLGACCKKIHFLFQGSCQKLYTVFPFSTNLAHPFSGNFLFHGILRILSQGVGCFDLAFLFWRIFQGTKVVWHGGLGFVFFKAICPSPWAPHLFEGLWLLPQSGGPPSSGPQPGWSPWNPCHGASWVHLPLLLWWYGKPYHQRWTRPACMPQAMSTFPPRPVCSQQVL